jgi:hypothetical protein
MSELQTQSEKKENPLSKREQRMIATRCECSTELVRRIVLGSHGFPSRKEKKILKGAKIIIVNRQKLAQKLDTALLDQE